VARHQGKVAAQRALPDFVHSHFIVSGEGPGGQREQGQASFSRSPGSGWAETGIHSQCGQQMWVSLASSTGRGSKTSGTAPAPYFCYHASSASQHSLLIQSF